MGSALRVLWSDSPAATRLLCGGLQAVSIALPLGAWLFPGLQTALLCCPYTVFRRGYVWAPFLSMVYRPAQGLLALLMNLVDGYLGMSYFSDRERDLGSCRFLAWAFISVGAVNALFLVAMLLLSLVIGPTYQLRHNQGLLPLLVVCVTLKALASPEDPVSVFGVAHVPRKWYPLVLGCSLSLLSLGVAWEVFAALAVGYAQGLLPFERLLLSPSRANCVEQSCCCLPLWRCLGAAAPPPSRLGWVPAYGALGARAAYDGVGAGRRHRATLPRFQAARRGQQVGMSGSLDMQPLQGGGAAGAEAGGGGGGRAPPGRRLGAAGP